MTFKRNLEIRIEVIRIRVGTRASLVPDPGWRVRHHMVCPVSKLSPIDLLEDWVAPRLLREQGSVKISEAPGSRVFADGPDPCAFTLAS